MNLFPDQESYETMTETKAADILTHATAEAFVSAKEVLAKKILENNN